MVELGIGRRKVNKKKKMEVSGGTNRDAGWKEEQRGVTTKLEGTRDLRECWPTPFRVISHTYKTRWYAWESNVNCYRNARYSWW